MGNEKIKQAIDNILKEKKATLQAKIDKAKHDIAAQLDALKGLDDLTHFNVPAGLDAGAGGGAQQITYIHRAIMKISMADNQLNLIISLLEGLKHFCSRAALFLIKEDKLVGWKGIGFSEHGHGINDDELKRIFFAYSAQTIFKQVLDTKENYSGPPQSQPDDHIIFSRIGGDLPGSIFVTPFFVKGKPQAVIYADSFQNQEIGKKEIEMIAVVGEMSLDLLPLKQKILKKVKTREFVDYQDTTELSSSPFPSADADTSPGILPGPPTSIGSPPTTSPPPMGPPEIDHSGDDNEITLPSVKESDPERLARVIINDIVLYNKKLVEEGRKKRALFRILEDTIMQAKELYLIKYKDMSFFEKQLVKQLAQGDKEALKGYKFETM